MRHLGAVRSLVRPALLLHEELEARRAALEPRGAAARRRRLAARRGRGLAVAITLLLARALRLALLPSDPRRNLGRGRGAVGARPIVVLRLLLVAAVEVARMVLGEERVDRATTTWPLLFVVRRSTPLCYSSL